MIIAQGLVPDSIVDEMAASLHTTRLAVCMGHDRQIKVAIPMPLGLVESFRDDTPGLMAHFVEQVRPKWNQISDGMSIFSINGTAVVEPHNGRVMVYLDFLFSSL